LFFKGIQGFQTNQLEQERAMAEGADVRRLADGKRKKQFDPEGRAATDRGRDRWGTLHTLKQV